MAKLLLTPLVAIVAALVLVAIVLRYGITRKNWRAIQAGLGFLLVCACLLYLFSAPPVARLLAFPLESRYPQPSEEQVLSVKTVIVLGAGALRLGPGAVEPTPTSAERVLSGIEVVRRSSARRMIVSGGFSEAAGVSVAAVMKSYALRQGMPGDMVLTDEESLSTWEHPVQVLKLAPDTRSETIAIVTSAWHLPRAVQVFSRYFDRIVAVPCDFISRGASGGLADLIPASSALFQSTTVLQEFIGSLWYAMRLSYSS